MAHQCRVCRNVNPADATYCYHDGRPLLKDVDLGPLPVGTLPFPTPFFFSDRQACTNFNQLALACDNHWDEARDLLAGGMWPQFFGAIGRLDLVQAAQQAAAEPDRDQGLSQLLHKLPADPDFLRPPKLVLEFPEMDLGKLTPGSDRTFEVVIHNQGMLLLYGILWSDCDWLAFGERSGRLCQRLFQTRKSYTLLVRVLGSKLHAGVKPFQGEIIVDTNGGRITLPVQAAVPIQPFPKGTYANDSLAGARSPREIAFKARAAPDQAAVLFEQGAVKAWYASNGWTYPIKGTGGVGKAAVQQFFEALGLAHPPRLEINTRSLLFQGPVGARLEQRVTISTAEAKPVYVQATSDQDWVQFGPFKYLGNKVKVPVAITVPPQPGKTVTAQVTIQGNGNQSFTVLVSVKVENALPPKNLAAPAPPASRTPPAGPQPPTHNPMVRWGVFAGGGGLFLLLILVGIFLVFAAQSGGRREEVPIPDVPPVEGGNVNRPGAAVKFATPGEVFAVLQKSYEDGKYETYVGCLTEESQDALAGMFVLAAGLLKKADKDRFVKSPLEQVFVQNKGASLALDKVAEGWKDFPSKQPSGAEVQKLLLALARPIPDKKIFLWDALNAAHGSVFNLPRTGLTGEAGVLKNLKETGDRATAQIDHNEGKPQPIAFRKVEGSWLVDFPAATFQPLQGLGNFHYAASQPIPLALENDKATVKDQLLNFYDPLDPVQQQPCRVFKLQTKQGKYYVLQLHSGDFQPYLRLEDAAGKEYGQRDDKVPGCIRFEAPHTGQYRIVATTTNRTGKFTLTIHREPQVELEKWLDTTFGSWDVRRHGTKGIFLVQNASQQVVYLNWSASDHVQYRDADGTAHKLQADSRSDQEPPSFPAFADVGKGMLRAKKLANGVYAKGDWKVTVKDDALEFQPAGKDDGGRLSLRRSADGFSYHGQNYRTPKTLSMNPLGQLGVSGKLQATDPLDPVRQQPCQVYKLQMTQGKTYVIDLAGQGFNAHLRLEDVQGKELRANGGLGTNAHIDFEPLRTGAYRIVATMRNSGSGHYFLKVQVKEPMLIPPDGEGGRYFLQNGARFGRWSIWPVTSAYLLVDRESGQVIYLNRDSLGLIYYRDAAGKWYYVYKTAKQEKDSPAAQKFLTLLKGREPTKKLANETYDLSGDRKWEFTVTDNQIEFRSSPNGDGTLTIDPFTEGFRFNGQIYGPGKVGASNKKPSDLPQGPLN